MRGELVAAFAVLTVVAPTATDGAELDPVAFEIGNAGFPSGDLVTIDRVRGDRRAVESGGTYEVCGRFELRSHDVATLALFSTNGEVIGQNRTKIRAGSGGYCFTALLQSAGYPHVSLYPSPGGQSFGGVYFGTGRTVYRGAYVSGT